MAHPHIVVTDPVSDPRWDQFVQQHPHGSLYHHSLWKQVIETTYGYEPWYLMLENSYHDAQAILPFFQVQSPITGSRLVSLPFSDYCDALVSTDNDIKPLYDFIQNRIEKVETKYLEIRTRNSSALWENDSLRKSSDSLNHFLVLNREPGDLWNSFHKSLIQRNIRKALKNKVMVKFGKTEQELRQVYRLLVLTRRKHGLPPPPFRFYRNLWRILKPRGKIHLLLAFDQNRPVAALILVVHKETVYYLYGGSNPDFLQNRPNHLLFWKAIEWSCAQGYQYFDFGRTGRGNAGLLRFKRNWGTVERELHHFWWAKDGEKIRLANRGSTKNGFLNRLFQKLPAPILIGMGNLIYKHMG